MKTIRRESFLVPQNQKLHSDKNHDPNTKGYIYKYIPQTHDPSSYMHRATHSPSPLGIGGQGQRAAHTYASACVRTFWLLCVILSKD